MMVSFTDDGRSSRLRKVVRHGVVFYEAAPAIGPVPIKKDLAVLKAGESARSRENGNGVEQKVTKETKSGQPDLPALEQRAVAEVDDLAVREKSEAQFLEESGEFLQREIRRQARAKEIERVRAVAKEEKVNLTAALERVRAQKKREREARKLEGAARAQRRQEEKLARQREVAEKRERRELKRRSRSREELYDETLGSVGEAIARLRKLKGWE